MKIVKYKISSTLAEGQPPEQAACRTGYSTIHTLSLLLEFFFTEYHCMALGDHDVFDPIKHEVVFSP